MSEMSNQQSLVQALAAVDEGNWTPIAVYVPSQAASQTIQYAVPATSRGLFATNVETPVLIGQNAVVISNETGTSSNVGHQVITCKKLTNNRTKLLRGNIGGVLLRDVTASNVRVPVTNSGSSAQKDVATAITGAPAIRTSAILRKSVKPGATISNVKNTAMQTKNAESVCFYRCNVCCAFSRPNVKLCGQCRAPFPANPTLYTRTDEKQTSITNLTKITNATSSSTAVATKEFYGKSLQSMGYAMSLPVEASAQLKVMKRIPRKRPPNDPPECLTISSDDEGHETKEENPPEEEGDEDTDTLELAMNDDEPSEHIHITDHPYAESAENNRGTPRPLVAQFPISNIRVVCRSLRIGSYRITTNQLVEVHQDKIIMTIPAVDNNSELVTIPIQLSDVSVIAHFGKMLPLLVLYTTTSAATDICCQLRMFKDEGPYFDPASDDETKKRIILLPESLSDENRVAVKIILKNYTGPRLCHQNEPMLREIDLKSANEVLVRSSPLELVAQLSKLAVPNNKRGRSSLSLQKDKDTPVFFARTPVIFPLAKQLKKNEVLKVATYPPPPETGGISITSEDLYCLVQGEFLNDVIIDFYLKYVLLEKLCEKDRKRTHIFSSFFYGRLTHPGMPSQQSIRAPQEAEDHSLPAAERRHSRVKTWTRHVDIFDKDFIIVPINENSHWLLAIICFPYLVCANMECDEEFSNNENEEIADEIKADESLDDSLTNGDLTACNEPSTVKRKKRQPRGDSANEKCIAKPCILIFDSLHSRSWTKYVVNLREYLKVEWKTKKTSDVKFDRVTMKGSYPAVPQQTNYSDCGVYVLQYVDSFFDNPIKDFTLPIREIGEWFSAETIIKKREDIRNLILKLKREQNEGDENDTNEENAPSVSASPSEENTELQEALANISDSRLTDSPSTARR